MIENMLKEFVDTFHGHKKWCEFEKIDFNEMLIREEFKEVMVAFDNYRTAEQFSVMLSKDKRAQQAYTDARAALLKELCDLVYVVVGAAVIHKLPFDKAFELVHKNNMSKVDEKGVPQYNDEGKLIKPANYKKVDLREIL